MDNEILHREFTWLLDVDVRNTLSQLKQILTECSTRFQMPIPNSKCIVKSNQYNLSFTSQNQLESIRAIVKLDCFKLTNADISIKLANKHPIKTCINESPDHPFPWRLHQIQDAANHLSYALDVLNFSESNDHRQESSDEVLTLVKELMNHIQKSRASLIVPKRRNIEELQNSQNNNALKPSLPIDFSISFYIQAHNLICSVYHLTQVAGNIKVKAEYKSEVSIPFLSEVLVYLSLSLQICQQLRDKITTIQSIGAGLIVK